MAYRWIPRVNWDKNPVPMSAYSYTRFGQRAVIHHTAGKTDLSYILEGKPGPKWYTQIRKKIANLQVRRAVSAYENKRRNVMNRERAAMRSWMNYHKSRGWVDIGYHAVIFPSGHVYEGRPWNTYGAHAINGNHMPGISFAGNMDAQAPTGAALASLDIVAKDNDVTNYIGHYKVPGNATSCPGSYLKRALRI